MSVGIRFILYFRKLLERAFIPTYDTISDKHANRDASARYPLARRVYVS